MARSLGGASKASTSRDTGPRSAWLGEQFHRATAGIPVPGFVPARADVFAQADRAAWDLGSLAPLRSLPPIARIAGWLRPLYAKEQLIHGDLTTNVLFHPTLPPGIIDLSPYWRPPLFPLPSWPSTIYRNVLAHRERILGADHPDTVWTRHELAWLAACDGHWAEAEAAYRTVLDVRRRTLGCEHADTLMTRHELAWAIANQGRAQEAEQLLIIVLAARQGVLGEEHPRTLWTRHELAWAIANQGRWAEAEAAYRDVLDARCRLLRPNHPAILTAMQELAWTIASQGRHTEALKLYQEVLDARRGILGEDDPDTLATSEAIERLRRGETIVPRHVA